MQVRYVKDDYFPYLTKDKIYDVMSIEKDWYRIDTDLVDDYIFPPELFEIVDHTDEERLRAEDVSEKWKQRGET